MPKEEPSKKAKMMKAIYAKDKAKAKPKPKKKKKLVSKFTGKPLRDMTKAERAEFSKQSEDAHKPKAKAKAKPKAKPKPKEDLDETHNFNYWYSGKGGLNGFLNDTMDSKKSSTNRKVGHKGVMSRFKKLIKKKKGALTRKDVMGFYNKEYPDGEYYLDE